MANGLRSLEEPDEPVARGPQPGGIPRSQRGNPQLRAAQSYPLSGRQPPLGPGSPPPGPPPPAGPAHHTRRGGPSALPRVPPPGNQRAPPRHQRYTARGQRTNRSGRPLADTTTARPAAACNQPASDQTEQPLRRAGQRRAKRRNAVMFKSQSNRPGSRAPQRTSIARPAVTGDVLTRLDEQLPSRLNWHLTQLATVGRPCTATTPPTSAPR